ncbi:ubiquitin-specific protease doa4 [Umbelopsis sp. WA50703]
MNIGGPLGSTIPQTPATSLSELRDRAEVNIAEAENYSVRSWTSSASKLYQQADAAYENDDLDNAYVFYLKGCSIIANIIRNHSQYRTIRKDPAYLALKTRTNDDILTKLEGISSILDSRFQDSGVPSSRNSSVSMSSVDDLPPAPTHIPIIKPSVTRPQQPTTIMKSAGKAPPAPPSLSSKPTGWKIAGAGSANITPQALTAQSKLSAQPKTPRSPIPLPSLTHNVFPQAMMISPNDLKSYLLKKEDPPSVLLVDVRAREVYNRGCIKHKWVVQLEPLVLRRDVTSRKVEESMVLAPPAEQTLFANRHRCDLVVYYDQSSTVLPTSYSDPLRNLKVAIYENEFSKSLQRVPVMLQGGFDAWVKLVGDRGVYVFQPAKDAAPSGSDNQENVPPINPVLSPHGMHPWMKNVVGRTDDDQMYQQPTNVNRTVMDYFNKQGDGSQAQSMTRSNAVKRPTRPPLQGIFGYGSQPTSQSSIHMPVPEPFHETMLTPTEEELKQRYPDIKENRSSVMEQHEQHPPGLQRRNTFIDNPFHGFTATASDIYEAPPNLPNKPTRPLPSPPAHAYPDASHTLSPPSIPAKPSSLAQSEFAGTTVEGHGQAPMSQSSFSQLGTVMIGTTGLKNLGNTCYMNSIIQCLSGTIPLARYFLSGMYKNHINTTNHMGTGGKLADAYANLIRVMWSESYNFLSPVTFRDAIIRFSPQFEGTEQHDSQEFLSFLLDGLHEDLNLVLRRPPPTPEDPEQEARFEQLPDWEASAIAWEKYLKRNSSVIVSLFQGQFRNRMQCLKCGTTSTTYNPFMTLSLPIPANRRGPSQVTLQQCLDYFVREEILEKDDAWHCPKCKTLRKATKQLTLSRLPDVLMIHLKRFSYDGPFNDKLETMVDFPIHSLDLTSYMPSWATKAKQAPDGSVVMPNYQYDLYAVSNHYGSLSGGHYTACVRNGYRGQWHLFDDARFSVCDDTSVKSRAAYGLFYVRATV